MAIDVGSSESSLRSDIDVTPMADVVIVLLIVFMVVTPALARHGVELPRTAAGEEAAPEPHEVVVSADGQTRYDSRHVLPGELEALLSVELQSRPGEVRVRADRRLSYGDVGPVIEACRRAGAERVAVVVEREVS
jgi:biopolymer transport protein ExbD